MMRAHAPRPGPWRVVSAGLLLALSSVGVAQEPDKSPRGSRGQGPRQPVLREDDRGRPGQGRRAGQHRAAGPVGRRQRGQRGPGRGHREPHRGGCQGHPADRVRLEGHRAYGRGREGGRAARHRPRHRSSTRPMRRRRRSPRTTAWPASSSASGRRATLGDAAADAQDRAHQRLDARRPRSTSSATRASWRASASTSSTRTSSATRPTRASWARRSSNGRQELGRTAMENLLTAHPDITSLHTINEPTAAGAYQALEAAGMTDQVTIVSVDGWLRRRPGRQGRQDRRDRDAVPAADGVARRRGRRRSTPRTARCRRPSRGPRLLQHGRRAHHGPARSRASSPRTRPGAWRTAGASSGRIVAIVDRHRTGWPSATPSLLSSTAVTKTVLQPRE